MLGYARSPLYLLMGVCLAGACLPECARAADPSNIVETVQAGDLDLASPEGAATLRHRVALAARNVCAWVDPDKQMSFEPFAECVRDATRQAAPQARAALAKAGRNRAVFAGADAAR